MTDIPPCKCGHPWPDHLTADLDREGKCQRRSCGCRLYRVEVEGQADLFGGES